MSTLQAVFDLVGAAGFFVGFALAVRLYRRQWLLGNYWLVASVGSLLLGTWAVVEAVEALGVAPGILESRLQILVLTTGMTAFVLLAVSDNTETETLLTRLRESERRTSALVDQYPDGAVLLLDDDMRCLEAGGEDLPGVADPSTLVDESVSAALDRSLVEAVGPLCQRAQAGESVTDELTHEGAIYEVTAVPVDDANGPSSRVPAERTCMLVFRNVTEERERERTLADQRDSLETLDRINRVIREVDHALVGAQSRAEIEAAICETLAGDGPYQFALVAGVEDDERFVARAWSGVGEAFVEEVFPVYSVGEDTPGTRALESGDIEVVEDVDGDPDFARWREAALEQSFRTLAVVPIHHGDRTFGVLAVFADRPGAFDERERAVLDQFGETVGYALASLEHREQADLLASLHETTRDLIGAQSAEAVGDIVLRACRDLLSVDAALFTYDETASQLTAAAATEGAHALYPDSDPGPDGPADDPVWAAFVSGDARAFDDLGTAEAFDATGDARSALVVPLGDDGVLLATSRERATFHGTERMLVELVAATTEAALERIERESDLHERERELRERNEQLARLQRFNDVIRDIDRTLVGASTREEVEQAVCEKLTGDDRCRFVWVGELEDGTVKPRAWAGDGGSYLDETDFEGSPAEPAARTLRTGEPTSVETVGDLVQKADWVSAALAEGFRSVASVPLRRGDVSYGVLTVYSGTAGTFDPETTSVFADLAQTIAYAIDAVETKRGLHAASGTELELRLSGAPSFLAPVARLSDDPIEVVEAIPQSEGRTRVQFRVRGVPEDDVVAATGKSVVVERVDHVGSHDDEDLYRAVVTGETVSETAVELGGVPRSVLVDEAGTTMVVSLLPHVDAREFVDRLREVHEDVELTARRESVGSRSHAEFMSDLDAALTDRQLEVLRTAYERGYYQTPRESSGEEVAAALGIAQPTVSHHLREGQRRLLSLLFGEREAERRQRPD